MTCQKSIVRKYVIVADLTVMGNMTRTHDEIIITNNLVIFILVRKRKSLNFTNMDMSSGKKRETLPQQPHTVLSPDFEDR